MTDSTSLLNDFLRSARKTIRSWLSAFHAWLPTRVDDIRVRVLAWLSFVAEVVIIATGGAVRLTGSGLGCPSWPTCTPESLVPTNELSYHSIIEFGNRTMSAVVAVLALLVVIATLRLRRAQRNLWLLSLVVLGGVLAQAFVGGLTVLTGLNPFIVGFHYVSSLVLVGAATAYLVLLYQLPARKLDIPRWVLGCVYFADFVLVVLIMFGVLTTGAGPHSGDAEAGRNGFDVTLLEHIHAWPGYILFGLTLVAVIASWTQGLPIARWVTAVLVIELVQIGVGLYQARNGLPVLPVGVHMVLAAFVVAGMTVVTLTSRESLPSSRSVLAGQ